jgi:hypothetical protein
MPKSPELPKIAKIENLLTADQRGLPRIKNKMSIYLSDYLPYPRSSAQIRGKFFCLIFSEIPAIP